MQNKAISIAVLGTGMVGKTIATKLVQRGQRVFMGSRSAGGAAAEWAKSAGALATAATFADAARAAEIVFNCTNGENSLAALRSAGADALAGKILIDVSNPLSQENFGTLTVCNTDSLGEQIQREFPAARVVKSLHTVNCDLMVDPSGLPGDHNIFVCGDDAAAKKSVIEYLGAWFGWPASRVLDLGGIQSARATEMYLPLWLALYRSLGHATFNLQIQGMQTTSR